MPGPRVHRLAEAQAYVAADGTAVVWDRNTLANHELGDAREVA